MYVTIRNKNAVMRGAAVKKQSSQREWLWVIGQMEPRSASRRASKNGREDSDGKDRAGKGEGRVERD